MGCVNFCPCWLVLSWPVSCMIYPLLMEKNSRPLCHATSCTSTHPMICWKCKHVPQLKHQSVIVSLYLTTKCHRSRQPLLLNFNYIPFALIAYLFFSARRSINSVRQLMIWNCLWWITAMRLFGSGNTHDMIRQGIWKGFGSIAYQACQDLVLEA